MPAVALWFAAGLAVTVSLAACGGAVQHTGGSTGAGGQLGSRAWTPALWAFYRYGGLEPAQALLVQRAEQSVQARCVGRYGFRYWPVPHKPGSVAGDDLTSSPGPNAPSQAAALRWDRAAAAAYEQHGSSLPPSAVANEQYVKSLSPQRRNEYGAVVYGDSRHTVTIDLPGGAHGTSPTDGCENEGVRAAYGSLARGDVSSNAVVAVQRLVSPRVTALATVRHAGQRWRGCMLKRSGHSFADPAALDLWLLSSPRAANHASRYLSASTRCAYATGLAKAFAAGTWHVLDTMPRAWYADIVQSWRWSREAVTRARRILRMH